VLTKRAFEQLQDLESYRRGFSSLVEQRRLLFLGHSLSDPDLELLLQETRELFGQTEGAPDHWLLSDTIAQDRARELRRLGVEPIEYFDHAHLPAILRYFATPDSGLQTPDLQTTIVATAPAAVQRQASIARVRELMLAQGAGRACRRSRTAGANSALIATVNRSEQLESARSSVTMALVLRNSVSCGSGSSQDPRGDAGVA
jgi:hypothetical protein